MLAYDLQGKNGGIFFGKALLHYGIYLIKSQLSKDLQRYLNS